MNMRDIGELPWDPLRAKEVTLASGKFDLDTTPENLWPESIMEILRPYEPDDNHMGTYLVLRIAGTGSYDSIKTVKRKPRMISDWRMRYAPFKKIDNHMEELQRKYGNQAKVLRAVMLDQKMVELGIQLFDSVIRDPHSMGDNQWAYLIQVLKLRMPGMVTTSPTDDKSGFWAKLPGMIKGITAQREITVREEPNGARSLTARETTRSSEVPANEITIEEPVIIGEKQEISQEAKDKAREAANKILAGILEKNKNQSGYTNSPTIPLPINATVVS